MGYNNFQDGGRPPSWISKFGKFSHSTVITFRFCILVEKSRKSDNPLPSYIAKNDVFQYGVRPPSWI